jgi:hypothetical protein
MVWATANTPYEKNAIWDKIKEIGGDNPSDIMADIKVEDNTDMLDIRYLLGKL